MGFEPMMCISTTELKVLSRRPLEYSPIEKLWQVYLESN
jgi:hypothetical protein